MYGRTLGAGNVATGVSVLPATGDSTPLFVVAASLIATGAVILVAAALVARKSRRAEA